MNFGSKLSALDTMYPATSDIIDLSFSDKEKSGYEARNCPEGGSVYGYLIDGEIGFDAVFLKPGVVFAMNSAEWNKARLSRFAKFWIVVRLGYRVPTTFTVPEAKGRLSYIDGCTDSMLVYPARKGDGSLSLLQFPAGIDQSWHTHPSIRLGYVLSGKGIACHSDGETALTEGVSFMLPPHGRHRFKTEGDEMRIIAYHPDGDWGPTDENHPMLNRTYLSDK